MKSSRGSCNDVLRKTKEDETNLDLRTENSHWRDMYVREADGRCSALGCGGGSEGIPASEGEFRQELSHPNMAYSISSFQVPLQP